MQGSAMYCTLDMQSRQGSAAHLYCALLLAAARYSCELICELWPVDLYKIAQRQQPAARLCCRTNAYALHMGDMCCYMEHQPYI
jgi:hypothetical protein